MEESELHLESETEGGLITLTGWLQVVSLGQEEDMYVEEETTLTVTKKSVEDEYGGSTLSFFL